MLDNLGKTMTPPATADVIEKSAVGELLALPLNHHLLPILLMAFILLTLLLACLYDCKVNRERNYCRKNLESETKEADKTNVYLYNGETGESSLCKD